MKSLFTLIITLSILTVFSSCNSNKDHKHDHGKQEQLSKEYTSNYICPMHCKGSGSEQNGQCPTCGMDYVKNDKKQQ